MARKLLKALLWSLAGLLLLVVVLAATLIGATSTESGLRWTWNTAKDYLPENIEIAEVRGRLIGPLEIHGLQVNTESMRLGVRRLRLEWSVSALLQKRLHIENLAIAGLEYTALPGTEPEEPSEPFALPQAINLPVEVRLDALTLDNAEIRTAPDAEPFVIERIHLLAGLNNKRWLIRELSAHGPQFNLQGGAVLTPRAGYSSEAKLKWEFRLPELAPLQGVTELQGNLGKMRVTQTLAAPYNINANVELKDLLGDLGINARIVLEKTQLAAIKKDLPTVTLDADINANGGLSDLTYQIKARAQESEYGSALLETAGRYTGKAVQIDQLDLTSPDTPGQLSAQGKVALSEGNALDLVLRWQKLQWPLNGDPEYSSPEGEFTLTGPLHNYKLDGGLRWVLAGAEQEGRLRLEGQGNTESFNLNTLALSGAPGTVEGNANIIWAPALKVDAELRGQNVNPGAIVAGWPGKLDLHLLAQAEQQADGLLVQVQKLHVDGQLREQPLRLDARGHYAPKLSVIEQLQLVAGETRLQAQGRIAEALDISWSLDSSDLGTTLPNAAGELHGNGQIAGTLEAPLVQARLNGTGLRYLDYRLTQLNLDADIDVSGARESSLNLNAEGGYFSGVILNSLVLTCNGTPSAHELTLDADSDKGKAEIALSGSLPPSHNQWAFTLQQVRLAYPQLAPWTLAGPASGLISSDKQQLEQACWRSDNAKLCLQANKTPAVTQAEFSLEDLALAYLKPFLPPDLELGGALSGNGDLRMTNASTEPDVNLQLTTSEISVVPRDAQGEPVQALAFAPGNLSATMAADGLEARADLPLLAGGGIQMDARIPATAATLMQRPLSGNINLLIEDLSALPALVPDIERAEGEVRGELALSGSLGAPQINGQVSLNAPVLSLAGPGLEIKDIVLSVIGRGQQLSLDMQVKSGGGSLTAQGDIGLGGAGLTVDMQVQGDKFKVLDTRDARVWASPDLSIALNPERIDVSGSVTIPKADITPKNLPASNGAVTVSDDQIIVKPGSTGEDAQLGRALHARVRLIVGDPETRLTDFAERGRNYADTLHRIPGDKVRFEGFGLKAIIVGNLLVTLEPAEPALGSGELRVVVGEYKAYGQDLTIQNGRVLFAGGPVSEPALDVRAVRRPNEELLVGVRVRGQLQQPDFKLFSEPPAMTQSEQLSWLVLGRPPNDASAAETSLVTRAALALALGVKGGNFLARNIGDRIGVDDIGIANDGSKAGQAALVVGKYLTPKLYVSYGLGLFEPVSTVRLRYILSPRWQLETQSSGTATGGDVIYSIERGGQ